MRTPRRLAAAGLLAGLVACAPTPQTLNRPQAVTATYRLLFNEQLVGTALFELQVDADGHYRFAAFTTPAGQMQQATGHEVLEISEGRIEDAGIRPQRFDHSVLQGEQIEVFRLLFDWPAGRLQLQGRDRSTRVALLPDTHDRLSYLLAARRLVASGGDAMRIRVAALESTDDSRLQREGEDTVETPFGSFRAQRVRRITPVSGENRALWFDTGLAPLPLRAVHEADGNRVEMRLESLSRDPSDPR